MSRRPSCNPTENAAPPQEAQIFQSVAHGKPLLWVAVVQDL